MSDVTFEELLDIACRMSEDIQEYVNEGEKSGSEMLASKELLDEFHDIYHRSNQLQPGLPVNQDPEILENHLISVINIYINRYHLHPQVAAKTLARMIPDILRHLAWKPAWVEAAIVHAKKIQELI